MKFIYIAQNNKIQKKVKTLRNQSENTNTICKKAV